MRRRFCIATAVFLTTNLVLLGLYLWSHSGQTTHVRVVANGNDFAAYVTVGSPRRPGLLLRRSGVILTLDDTTAVPLPKPSGIDWVRVTDLSTGNVLFEDDFSSGAVGVSSHQERQI